MRAFTGVNLALRFALELAALAALAVWGAQATSSTAANIALAIAAPALAIAIWAVWSAPRAPRRLHGPALVVLELALLAASAVALAAAGHVLLACILAVLAIANGVALSRFRD
jgi:multisubunit Na+/H+ antiporter MnhF subunit